MTGRALILQGDARKLPLPDSSVDLIVTSPPFWNLRDYGVPGQIGNEVSRRAFLEELWEATRECMRVMKPTASLFVELGDSYSTRYSSQRGAGWAGLNGDDDSRARSGQNRTGSPEKSLNLTPQRYVIGCVDDLGLTLRAEIIWDRPNGLPESVKDRVRLSHSRWWHLVKQPRYYSALDEVREPHSDNRPWGTVRRATTYIGNGGLNNEGAEYADKYHPLGKLPGSVWTIASEPLTLPGYFIAQDGTLLDFLAPTRGGPRSKLNGNGHGLFDPDAYAELIVGEDAGAWRWSRSTGINASPWPKSDVGLQLHTAASHYAAFPSRWPRRLILGFSPPGICVDCDQGRVPVVEREEREPRPDKASKRVAATNGAITGGTARPTLSDDKTPRVATILGYACSCTPYTDHPGTGESTGPHGIAGNDPRAGNGYEGTGQGQGWGGKQHLADRPKTGPWREYHLDGWKPPPTRPAVILDPFGGTGTTAMVAKALGRIGVSVDLSHAYGRAARWRVTHDGAKAISRTNLERQGMLL